MQRSGPVLLVSYAIREPVLQIVQICLKEVSFSNKRRFATVLRRQLRRRCPQLNNCFAVSVSRWRAPEQALSLCSKRKFHIWPTSVDFWSGSFWVFERRVYLKQSSISFRFSQRPECKRDSACFLSRIDFNSINYLYFICRAPFHFNQNAQCSIIISSHVVLASQIYDY